MFVVFGRAEDPFPRPSNAPATPKDRGNRGSMAIARRASMGENRDLPSSSYRSSQFMRLPRILNQCHPMCACAQLHAHSCMGTAACAQLHAHSCMGTAACAQLHAHSCMGTDCMRAAACAQPVQHPRCRRDLDRHTGDPGRAVKFTAFGCRSAV